MPARKQKPAMQVHAPFYLSDEELAALQSWYEKTFPKYKIQEIVRGHSGATVIYAQPMEPSYEQAHALPKLQDQLDYATA